MYNAAERGPMCGLHTTGAPRAAQGHKIKNPKSEIYKALRTIPVDCRVILTGTPIQNNLMEAHSLFDFACRVRSRARPARHTCLRMTRNGYRRLLLPSSLDLFWVASPRASKHCSCTAVPCLNIIHGMGRLCHRRTATPAARPPGSAPYWPLNCDKTRN